jgi:hypothetical protein
VDGAPVRIIGVLPRDFELPTLEQADLLVPQALRIAHYTQGESGRPLRVFGRLKDGMTPERAAAMLQPFFQLAMEFAALAQRKQVSVALHSVRDFQIHDVRLASWVLFGTTLAVLLIVCANVANLLLARFAARQREFAMRRALGAGCARLMRQTLTESLLLCGCGAAAGCGLAWAMLRALRSIAPASIPRISRATLDGRVLLFTLAATVFCVLALGVPPAFSSMKLETLAGWRGSVNTAWMAMRIGGRADRGLAGVAVERRTAAREFVAYLAHRSRSEHGTGSNGRHHRGSAALYATPAQRALFFENLMDRLRANPLVTAAALSDTVPPAGFAHNHPFAGLHVEGRPLMENGVGGVVWRRTVSADYFAGREFALTAGAGSMRRTTHRAIT